MEYLKIIKEVNKKDFSNVTWNFTREREIDNQDCSEFGGSMEFEGFDVTFRELLFIRNGYGNRLRFWMPPWTPLYGQPERRAQALTPPIEEEASGSLRKRMRKVAATSSGVRLSRAW